jgi:hypothetical protein
MPPRNDVPLTERRDAARVCGFASVQVCVGHVGSLGDADRVRIGHGHGKQEGLTGSRDSRTISEAKGSQSDARYMMGGRDDRVVRIRSQEKDGSDERNHRNRSDRHEHGP